MRRSVCFEISHGSQRCTVAEGSPPPSIRPSPSPSPATLTTRSSRPGLASEPRPSCPPPPPFSAAMPSQNDSPPPAHPLATLVSAYLSTVTSDTSSYDDIAPGLRDVQAAGCLIGPATDSNLRSPWPSAISTAPP